MSLFAFLLLALIAVATSSSDADGAILEDYTKIGKSHIWKLMDAYYSGKGISTWMDSLVPHYITSNNFIARQYVKVCLLCSALCLSLSLLFSLFSAPRLLNHPFLCFIIPAAFQWLRSRRNAT